VVLQFTRDSYQRLDAAIGGIRNFTPHEQQRGLSQPRPFAWGLDRFLQRRGLEITSLRGHSRPLLQLVMPDGVWSLYVANVSGKRLYWTDNRGERHLIATGTEWVGSADRIIAGEAIASNALWIPRRRIVEKSAPTQVITSIHPHRFLLGAFHACFDFATVWQELEERYGPRDRLPREEQEQIAKEKWASVRTWIVAQGTPDRIREAVLSRERRVLVERWLEAVVATGVAEGTDGQR
jgi:hypothetical protein